jgi:hypothetical protein
MLARALAVALVALAACGTSTKPAGAVCSQMTECESSLDCLELGQFSGSACTAAGKVCTHSCQQRGDCTDLGSNFDCFATCSGGSICGATLGP